MGGEGAMTTMLSQRDGLRVLTQTLAVSTAGRREALDITADVRDGVRRAGIHNGLVVANYRTQFDRIMRTASYQELARKMRAHQREFSAPGAHQAGTPRS